MFCDALKFLGSRRDYVELNWSELNWTELKQILLSEESGEFSPGSFAERMAIFSASELSSVL